MKKFLITLAAFVMSSSPVQAQTADSLCPSLGRFAEQAMKARQLGIAKSKIMSILNPDDPTYELTVTIIDLAYSKPVMPKMDDKAQLVIMFSDAVLTACYKNFMI